MKKSLCLLVLTAAFTTSSWAACKPPQTPNKIPDGATSTLEQMKAAMEVVNQFQAKMDDYQACIKGEYDAQLKKYPKADDELKKGFLEDYKRKDDAAMDEKVKTVDALNAQIAAYKAAHPK